MKKILAFAILAALLMGALWSLTGCTGLRASAYENPERYTVGDAVLTDGIDRIEIEWASGSVRVIPHDGDGVRLSEVAKEGLPEDADFTASVHSTSGDFESGFALRRDGGCYICGSGRADVRIETTSGDASIRPN